MEKDHGQGSFKYLPSGVSAAGGVQRTAPPTQASLEHKLYQNKVTKDIFE